MKKKVKKPVKKKTMKRQKKVLSPPPLPDQPKEYTATPEQEKIEQQKMIEVEKKLLQFRFIREKCRNHIKSEMYLDLKDVKNLDDHIKEFVNIAKKDLKNANPSDVLNITKKFENEIYEELDIIIKNANEDMDLLKDILNALNNMKKELDFKNESSRLIGFEKYEIRFAENTIDTTKNKLKEIRNTFEQLRKNG